MRAISANIRAEIHHELELEEMKQIMQEQQALFEQQMREQKRQLHAVETDLEQLSDLEHSAISPSKSFVQRDKPSDDSI
jgi:hypothetical protein